ncbi:hypothetical protein QAD02_000263 [Eretmocerus hayati]|uniref:Uncharacterized protein n=1 Tax=Eretmocerus hayati TaxID=131215 RepID=A0ACC2NF92_9HYME|nr:hypothetical protein QAD02_000263 [Eretmocerus hayati]
MKKIFSSRFVFYFVLCICSYIDPARCLTEAGTYDIEENAFPSLATLVKLHYSIPICSGTLITGGFVLTMATCLDKIPMDQARIILGGVGSENNQRYHVAWWKNCSGWSAENQRDFDANDPDIAVIRLASRVHFTENVGLAILPLEYDVPIFGEQISLVGWTKFLHLFLKRAATKKIQMPDVCAQYFKKNVITRTKVIEGKLFCTIPEPHLGAFDIGGPVYLNKNVLVGINYESTKKLATKNLHVNHLYYKDFLRYMLYYLDDSDNRIRRVAREQARPDHNYASCR